MAYEPGDHTRFGVAGARSGAAFETHAERERADPQEPARRLARVLDSVIDKLQRDGLIDLYDDHRTPPDGGWFRFHRQLRFGYGSADDDRSVAAAVFVDRDPIDECGRAGLLMHGAPRHLREPYRPDEGEPIYGARSGSRNGYLFRWLETVREALESDERTDLSGFDEPLFRRGRDSDGPTAPRGMYRLFASDGWMTGPRFGQLANAAPCEGIAQASSVSVHDQTTVVMASPLYVRILSMAGDALEAGAPPRGRRRFGLKRYRP
jgi:hypothetical protein